ncbi:aldo/keto reductase [Oricola cellulosilytica]|uniref:Oxidoreductase n=1 Tax=Oricola cellulosilytica TaxID=1429082 RepID=A0A4R0PD76_9HYPH|nr:aldo/keto reductase [Oricola cellulosilytica]TCD14378.1 oxidoreductase [Oricola cellulosilytica]
MTVPKLVVDANLPAFSRLIYGVWRLGDDADTSPRHIQRKVEACLDQGITTFDHADIYGGYACERLFGEALALRHDLKSRIQVITKCDIMLMSETYPDRRVKYYDTSAAHIRASAETALKRIGVEVIDLMLIHRPDPLMDSEETGAALDALVDDGLVRGVGVSNFMPWDVDLLQASMKQPLLANQIEISLLERSSFTNGQLSQIQLRGMSPMAWSPLAGGALFDRENAAAARLAPRLDELGREHGVGADAVALAWIMTHPANIMPVVGTNNPNRIERLSDCLKVDIDRETWFELWTLAEGKEVP